MQRVCIVILFFVSALAAPRSIHRIVGGEDTRIELYPFMASMLAHWWGATWSQTCGGSLLTPSVVMSAAHCYFGDIPQSWRVRLGSPYPHSGGSVYTVSELVIHEGFHPAHLNHDISLVRLVTPAVLGESVGTAMIAGNNYILPDNTPVTAVGWGNVWYGGPGATILQSVNIVTIERALCVERYADLKLQPHFGFWPDVTENMVCAGLVDEGGKNVCHGDSGGPLVHNGNVVYGVTSWGYECAHDFYPAVSSFVPKNADWIVANA